MAGLSAAVYTLCVAISRYKPPVVIAFAALLLNLVLVLDAAAPASADGPEVSATGVAVTAGEAEGNAISTIYGQILLLIMSVILLVAVLMQRRWMPAAAGRYRGVRQVGDGAAGDDGEPLKPRRRRLRDSRPSWGPEISLAGGAVAKP